MNQIAPSCVIAGREICIMMQILRCVNLTDQKGFSEAGPGPASRSKRASNRSKRASCLTRVACRRFAGGGSSSSLSKIVGTRKPANNQSRSCCHLTAAAIITCVSMSPGACDIDMASHGIQITITSDCSLTH